MTIRDRDSSISYDSTGICTCEASQALPTPAIRYLSTVTPHRTGTAIPISVPPARIAIQVPPYAISVPSLRIATSTYAISLTPATAADPRAYALDPGF
eukprot:915495-Rhodomonas_salina.1